MGALRPPCRRSQSACSRPPPRRTCPGGSTACLCGTTAGQQRDNSGVIGERNFTAALQHQQQQLQQQQWCSRATATSTFSDNVAPWRPPHWDTTCPPPLAPRYRRTTFEYPPPPASAFALLTEVLEGSVYPDDVGMAELVEGALLHQDLVEHVRVLPLDAFRHYLVDRLEGEWLPGSSVLGLDCGCRCC